MIARHIQEEPLNESSNGALEQRAVPGNGMLSRCVIRSLVGLRCGGNHFYFHIRSLWQGGNLDCGTARGILFEIRAVCFVYGLKVAEISQEYGCLDDVIKGQTVRS